MGDASRDPLNAVAVFVCRQDDPDGSVLLHVADIRRGNDIFSLQLVDDRPLGLQSHDRNHVRAVQNGVDIAPALDRLAVEDLNGDIVDRHADGRIAEIVDHVPDRHRQQDGDHLEPEVGIQVFDTLNHAHLPSPPRRLPPRPQAELLPGKVLLPQKQMRLTAPPEAVLPHLRHPLIRGP